MFCRLLRSETSAPAPAPVTEEPKLSAPATEEEHKKEEKTQSPKMYRRLSARIGQFLQHDGSSSKKASKKPAVAEEHEGAAKEGEAPKIEAKDEAPVVSCSIHTENDGNMLIVYTLIATSRRSSPHRSQPSRSVTSRPSQSPRLRLLPRRSLLRRRPLSLPLPRWTSSGLRSQLQPPRSLLPQLERVLETFGS